jgi:hypothetical protein
MSAPTLTAEPARLPWPARLPFSYGWVSVALAALAMSATLPGRTYGLGLIKEPLRQFTFSAVTLDSEALLAEHGLGGRRANELVLGVLMVSGLPANLLAGWLAARRPLGRLLAAVGRS